MMRRQSGGNTMMWMALGVAGGLLGGSFLTGWLLGKRSTAEKRPPALKIWQRALSRTRGVVAAGFITARVQERYSKLYAERPRFENRALRAHLEDNILPGLALYQVLCEEAGGPGDAVQAEVDDLLGAQIQSSPLAIQGRLLEKMPDPFSTFRWYHNQFLPRQYPAEGWRFEWVEDSPDVVAYNCTDCFYHNILTRYGAPELTKHFCRLDDLMFERFPVFTWKRTKTLGRGDECCNFRFERVE